MEDFPLVINNKSGDELHIAKRSRTDIMFVSNGNIIAKQHLEPDGKSELGSIRSKD